MKVNRTRNQIVLSLNQFVIDWINQKYPERNFYYASGPVFNTVAFENSESFTRNCGPIEIEVPLPAMLFWYNFADDTEKDLDLGVNTIKAVISKVAGYMVQTVVRNVDIYMNHIVLDLVLVDALSPNFVDTVNNCNGNAIARVGVKTTCWGHYERQT